MDLHVKLATQGERLAGFTEGQFTVITLEYLQIMESDKSTSSVKNDYFEKNHCISQDILGYSQTLGFMC